MTPEQIKTEMNPKPKQENRMHKLTIKKSSASGPRSVRQHEVYCTGLTWKLARYVAGALSEALDEYDRVEARMRITRRELSGNKPPQPISGKR
jgi:hypothetical protein